jgi:hypothetical protein
MKHVYTGRDEMDANFVKGLLEQEGIEAVVQGQTLEATWGTLPLSAESLPSVWVTNDADEVRAAPIVERYRQVDLANANEPRDVDRPTQPAWTCPRCGEKLEEQFVQCWKCGTNRPAADAAGSPTV